MERCLVSIQDFRYENKQMKEMIEWFDEVLVLKANKLELNSVDMSCAKKTELA